jgi:hypothetical protein
MERVAADLHRMKPGSSTTRPVSAWNPPPGSSPGLALLSSQSWGPGFSGGDDETWRSACVGVGAGGTGSGVRPTN